MNKAGDYTTKLTWLKLTRVVNTENGQWEDTYSHNGYLRCSVEETSGRRESDDGSVQTGAQADIRIRQYPAFTALDLLYDPAFGYVWLTDSVRVGDNELILDSYRRDNDSVDNYNVEEGS